MACLCDCGGEPASRKSRFLPGHDTKLLTKMANAVGGHEALKELVEEHLNRPLG